MENIRSYKELRVYKAAMDAAMKIFELSKRFPPEERYSLTDQIRAEHLDPFAQISAKGGESGGIPRIS